MKIMTFYLSVPIFESTTPPEVLIFINIPLNPDRQIKEKFS
jgi:hypothetical protein